MQSTEPGALDGEPVGQLGAQDPGHDHVGQEEIDRAHMTGGPRNGIVGVLRGQDREPGTFEDARREDADQGFVLDQ